MRFALTPILLLSLAAGCGEGSSSTPQASDHRDSSTSASTATITGTATVHGVVRYEGPTLSVVTTPGEKCHTGAPVIQDESVVVSSAGALRNTIVYIEGAPAYSSDIASKPLVLDQVHCKYVPHVVALQVNQPLNIRSSDDTLHNVHYSPELNPAANFGLVKAGHEKTVSFKIPEFMKVTCDVHPWMSAWIAVFENPLFSVTNEAGAYEIKNVPAGKYTLVSWHERFGRQEKAIEIADSQTIDMGFLYKAPG